MGDSGSETLEPTTRTAKTQSRRRQTGGLYGRISQLESFWRDNFHWLAQHGYQLRPRYHPDWKPSWEGTNKQYYNCSDGLGSHYAMIVDAQRATDGELLVLKRTSKRLHPYEAEIGQFFWTPPLREDPHNHCVPIYDVLHVPGDEDAIILVMPLLKEYDEPPFDTIGEAVEFFRQIFEGLHFMHANHVAHRDVTHFNILMDARHLYPERYHPFQPSRKLDMSGPSKATTRTSRPVRYYLADFGISRKYRPEERPPLEDIIIGGDKTVPEFETRDECDPFPTDVYTIGNLIRERFTEGSEFGHKKHGFEFMRPLVEDMTHPDPSKRPTMGEVVERYDKIYKNLSSAKLRSRVIRFDEFYLVGLFRTIVHWIRRISYILKHVPPLPTPP